MGSKPVKKKILFVYDHEYPDTWRDGLWAALKLLEKDYEIAWYNLHGITEGSEVLDQFSDHDYFILGWGAFGSRVDRFMQILSGKKGLCIAGNALPPLTRHIYDVLFYETDWYKPQIADHPNIIKAFGVNTDIYRPRKLPKVWDFLTVGAFAAWKRQHLLTNKHGRRLAVGQIQQGNLQESMIIVHSLVTGGCMVSDMVEPEELAQLYNRSRCVYIPANIDGGGERAVLEARACGIPVEVEHDNEKLIELMVAPIPNHHIYAMRLKEGIESCL